MMYTYRQDQRNKQVESKKIAKHISYKLAKKGLELLKISDKIGFNRGLSLKAKDNFNGKIANASRI